MEAGVIFFLKHLQKLIIRWAQFDIQAPHNVNSWRKWEPLIPGNESRILSVGCENPAAWENKPSVLTGPDFCGIKYFWK